MSQSEFESASESGVEGGSGVYRCSHRVEVVWELRLSLDPSAVLPPASIRACRGQSLVDRLQRCSGPAALLTSPSCLLIRLFAHLPIRMPKVGRVCHSHVELLPSFCLLPSASCYLRDSPTIGALPSVLNLVLRCSEEKQASFSDGDDPSIPGNPRR